MHETCKPPLTPAQLMMQRIPNKSWRYKQGDIAMNATHSRMRSVASTLVGTAVLLLVSCSLGTQGPAGGFVLAAVPKGPQAHTVVIREVKFQPTVLTVKLGILLNGGTMTSSLTPPRRQNRGNSTPAFFLLAVPGNMWSLKGEPTFIPVLCTR